MAEHDGFNMDDLDHILSGQPAPEEVLAGLDFDLTDALVSGGPVDMTATLMRRFAWDITPCSQVVTMLEALGLVKGTPEGLDHEHRESHHRLAMASVVEGQIRAYSSVLGTVLTKAIVMANTDPDDGEGLCPEHESHFANQNAMIILHGARAIIAQLMFAGVLQPGPAAGTFQVVVVDKEDGEDV